jgi:hypothetical protein
MKLIIFSFVILQAGLIFESISNAKKIEKDNELFKIINSCN